MEKKGYRLEIKRERAIWPGKLGYLTDKSQNFDKLVVDFIRNEDDFVYFRWMPRYSEVVEIVKAMLEDHNSSELRASVGKVLEKDGN